MKTLEGIIALALAAVALAAAARRVGASYPVFLALGDRQGNVNGVIVITDHQHAFVL